jgi:hypothetical protein
VYEYWIIEWGVKRKSEAEISREVCGGELGGIYDVRREAGRRGGLRR